MSARRAAVFAIVGVMGFGLQLTILAALMSLAGWSYLPATCVAVEAAVLHNFAWHERWTWRDRQSGARTVAGRLARFNVTSGLTSIAGNAALMAVAVGGYGIHPIVANVLATAAMTWLNLFIADSWVFTARAVTIAVLVCATATAASAQPPPEALKAWDAYTAAAEIRIQRDMERPRTQPRAGLEGETVAVPGGTIHHWSGDVLVRAVTLDVMADRLMHPGTPPPQDDVVESRVLWRSGNASWHVYLKLARHSIVAVTYDTEHDVTFTRLSPGLARSRSIATRIVEADGEDRGFLWRLNSYWRYQQVGRDVLVEMESVTLSRAVPALLRPLALPIVARVARESVRRTLDAFRCWFNADEQAAEQTQPAMKTEILKVKSSTNADRPRSTVSVLTVHLRERVPPVQCASGHAAKRNEEVTY
jgi:putative flippase GtrA